MKNNSKNCFEIPRVKKGYTMNIFTRQEQVIGKEAQEKLRTAKITVVGVGGLGSVVAHILVRMGIGTLILQDFDMVADHNLSRQHLYGIEDVGKSKVQSLKKHLENIHSETKIICKENIVGKKEDLELSDLIIDCTDNHKTRQLIDSFCKENKISWVHGAAIKEHGTVYFFNAKNENFSYENIYGENPEEKGCGEEGVIVTITTIVGTLQAQMVMDHIIEREVPKEMLRINSENYSIEKINITK